MKSIINTVYSTFSDTLLNFNCTKVIFTVALISSVFISVACSKNSEQKESVGFEATKTQQQLDSIAKTKAMRKARREQALSSVNLGYVDQSKIVSNGKDFGVKVLAARLTAKGYMLDFRFHISDVEKAKEIMQRKIKAKLIVEKDKAKLAVPVSYKLGSLRQSGNNLVSNKNYFMFFANPGGHVKPGDLVTFELGGFKAEHITVN
ncbi:hypothetical protein MNBD_GAMMA22-2243 [hydrothermal vent metagenome]|uniref:Uncharacterized protein n=1 Tax=hydrothermal vent metagenome TaxID=652676 RepID=A0A3B0ZZJ8_9ZZZZ